MREDFDHAQALFESAWAAQRQGQMGEAAGHYDRLFAQLKELGKYRYNNNYGIILEGQGDDQRAVEQMLRSTEFHPSLDFVWAHAVRVLIRQQRNAEALSLVEQLVASPSSKALLDLRHSLEKASAVSEDR